MANEEEDPLDRLSGEPLLGPRQANLVDAVTYRLNCGSPLTSYDVQAVAWLRDLLGLNPAADPPVERTTRVLDDG